MGLGGGVSGRRRRLYMTYILHIYSTSVGARTTDVQTYTWLRVGDSREDMHLRVSRREGLGWMKSWQGALDWPGGWRVGFVQRYCKCSGVRQA